MANTATVRSGETIEAVEIPVDSVTLNADPTSPGDRARIELNRAAMRQMPGHVELAIVPGATHLFEEPGTLDRVEALAADWFKRYLRAAS